MFSSGINQVDSTRIIKFSSEGNKNHHRSISSGAISKGYKIEAVLINADYENLEHPIKAIKAATGLTEFSHQFNKVTGVLVLFLVLGKKEAIIFPDRNIELFGL